MTSRTSVTASQEHRVFSRWHYNESIFTIGPYQHVDRLYIYITSSSCKWWHSDYSIAFIVWHFVYCVTLSLLCDIAFIVWRFLYCLTLSLLCDIVFIVHIVFIVWRFLYVWLCLYCVTLYLLCDIVFVWHCLYWVTLSLLCDIIFFCVTLSLMCDVVYYYCKMLTLCQDNKLSSSRCLITGPLCATVGSVCTPGLCKEPLVCYGDGPRYTCSCPEGRTGDNCQDITELLCTDYVCRSEFHTFL